MKTKSLSMKQITVTDSFWKSYMELVRKRVIPYQWDALNDRIPGAEPSHCLQNFRIAAKQETGPFAGMVFQDSDVYKWLEAVSFSLMWHPDPGLEKLADETIDLIGAAQQPDGYLNTYYIINGLEKRFTNLRDNHELYCLGHMIEAAVAYYKSTGKRKFLDIAIKYVDCVNSVLGPESGKKRGYPGHQVIEMGLMKLFEITGEQKYLALAKYFIDERGKEPLYFKLEGEQYKAPFFWKDSYFQYQYYQAGKPVRKQKTAEGHAVRAVYLYSGMADVAEATGDTELFKACEQLWDSITQKQMYITGSIGSQHYGESFSFEYDLPNDAIYGETCAAIGLVFFARRMFEQTRDSKYIDVMERALFNGILSGMSLDGTAFFYVNPLEAIPEAFDKLNALSASKYQRQKWFGCSCCPPNIARLISSIGEYAYAQDEKTFFMNLFIGGKIETQFAETPVTFTVDTGYPWYGNVKIQVEIPKEIDFSLAIRIPGWCTDATAQINGENVSEPINKGYLYLSNRWKSGDTIDIAFPITEKVFRANPKVREDVGKIAVMRGPIVYCLEEADNGKDLHTLYIEQNPKITAKFEPEICNGVFTLRADGMQLSNTNWEDKCLYSASEEKYEKKTLRFIPYYAWANRSPGEMLVWVHKK